MGWDAYSSVFTTTASKHPTFNIASKRIENRCGAVDHLLQRGGLDLSGCGEALADATGCSVYDPDGWDAAKVRDLATTTVWPDESTLDPRQLEHMLCARAFLETCAKLNVSIRFSY